MSTLPHVRASAGLRIRAPRAWLAGVLVSSLSTGVFATQPRPVPEGFKEFKAVDDYAALHTRVERSLPKLSTEATPEQIDRNQRALASLIVPARAMARPGDVFTPATQAELKRVMGHVFATMDRARLRATILDEHAHLVVDFVNNALPK